MSTFRSIICSRLHARTQCRRREREEEGVFNTCVFPCDMFVSKCECVYIRNIFLFWIVYAFADGQVGSTRQRVCIVECIWVTLLTIACAQKCDFVDISLCMCALIILYRVSVSYGANIIENQIWRKRSFKDIWKCFEFVIYMDIISFNVVWSCAICKSVDFFIFFIFIVFDLKKYCIGYW